MFLYFPVLLGTVREGRSSVHVARYVADRLGRRPEVEARLFDPKDLPFGNLVRREWEMDPVPPDVASFVREMGRADGFVIVTPEYNYGIPGTLKNLLDHLFHEWNRKPFALVGCGALSGGVRAVDQLRQVVTGLQGVVVPPQVYVTNVHSTFGPGGPLAEAETWNTRLDRMFSELEWYARALSRARAGE
ncbi:MAG TPA: NAD(P)H-dependent oxidoreductase [Thermoplasmata archaeon]|nr:NAD(P)H-dependent oxidoreductase [Thermoplasmata archaeon]